VSQFDRLLAEVADLKTLLEQDGVSYDDLRWRAEHIIERYDELSAATKLRVGASAWMKTYLVFAGHFNDPKEGWNTFKGDFDTLAEAEQFCPEGGYNWKQVVGTGTKSILSWFETKGRHDNAPKLRVGAFVRLDTPFYKGSFGQVLGLSSLEYEVIG